MGDDAAYRGWLIEPQSYRSDGGRWRPKAIVSASDGGSVRTYQVLPPLGDDVAFDTEEAADAHAVKMAKSWIDDHG